MKGYLRDFFRGRGGWLKMASTAGSGATSDADSLFRADARRLTGAPVAIRTAMSLPRLSSPRLDAYSPDRSLRSPRIGVAI